MSPLVQRIAAIVRGAPPQWPVEAFQPLPATPQAVATAEQTLGFPLPPPLRELYLNARNGTFGPGRGLLPVGGRKVGNPALSLEVQYSRMLHFGAEEVEDATLVWPDRLLPLCHWGCDIWSCTQCGTNDSPIVRFDANEVRPGAMWESCFSPEAASLEQWLEAWLRSPSRGRRWPRSYPR